MYSNSLAGIKEIRDGRHHSQGSTCSCGRTDLQRACPDALRAVVGGVVGGAVQEEGDVQPRQVPIVSPAGEDEGVGLVLWDCCIALRGPECAQQVQLEQDAWASSPVQSRPAPGHRGNGQHCK